MVRKSNGNHDFLSNRISFIAIFVLRIYYQTRISIDWFLSKYFSPGKVVATVTLRRPLKTMKEKRGTRLDRRHKARCETKYSRVARVFCVVTLSANEIRLRKETRAVAAETAGFSSYLGSTMGHHRDVSRAVISWLSPWRQSLRNGCILVTYGVPDGKICVRPSIWFAGFRDIHCLSIAVV